MVPSARPLGLWINEGSHVDDTNVISVDPAQVPLWNSCAIIVEERLGEHIFVVGNCFLLIIGGVGAGFEKKPPWNRMLDCGVLVFKERLEEEIDSSV